MTPSLKSSLMEESAEKRGLECERLNVYLTSIAIGGRALPFLQMNGVFSSSATRYICDHKHLTKSYLAEAGIPVIEGLDFGLDEDDAVAAYAESLGYPVVVKPNSLSKAEGVHMAVTSRSSVREAVAAIRQIYVERFGTPSSISRVLLEREFPDARMVRFFVAGGRMVAATEYRPATVTGDGDSTVLELIQRRNRMRARREYWKERLIPEELSRLPALGRRGLGLAFVPGHGEEVPLNNALNPNLGAETIDVTDRIHPSFGDLAVRAIQAIPGMRYGGVDILLADLDAGRALADCAVCEVEFSPAPGGAFPWAGQPRDLAGAVLDLYVEAFG